MSGLEARERAVLRGEIARIIYENDDGSFAVLRIRETGSREYTARGALAGLAAGQVSNWKASGNSMPNSAASSGRRASGSSCRARRTASNAT